MTYQQTLDYLFAQLPMYQRLGPAAYKADLSNTLAISRYLGHPEKSFRSIHIAGTNGKGSVAHMMASVLQSQGYATGLATSPHLKDFRERIRINGRLIPKNYVSRFAVKHKAFFDTLRPSFFEMAMAMTFAYFADRGVDIAVVETGLGGRLDSTNIITPELSVITNIGLDHTQLLGNTLAGIAAEKAGIIKEGVGVVVGRRQPDIHGIFEQTARRQGATLQVATDVFELVSVSETIRHGIPGLVAGVRQKGGGSCEYFLDLPGHYQQENLLTALAAFEALAHGDRFRVSARAIAGGLSAVRANTGLRGRWEVMGRNPLILCDTAHNADAIRQVCKQLLSVPHKSLLMVMGMVEDKERDSILGLLPPEADYYFCRPAVPRGLNARKLASDASFRGLRGKAYDSVQMALEAAKNDASADDLIFVGGSTFVVSEVI